MNPLEHFIEHGLPPLWLLGLPLVFLLLRAVFPRWSERWGWSHDHKVVAKQFLFSAILFGLVGGLLSMIMRWQLGWPGQDVPHLQEHAFPDSQGLPPEAYNMAFTLHGTIMIWFTIVPLMLGAFGNFILPLMIGSRRMAFPAMTALSYWLMWPAFFLVCSAWFAEGEGVGTGWTAYPPNTAMMTGHGQTLWLLGIWLVGIAQTMSAINVIATIFTMRTRGLGWGRLPLTVWGLLVTAILGALATPVLSVGLLMQIGDRLFGTSFFLPAARVLSDVPQVGAGGSPILWQHLFWFYSHPVVYMMVLPAMGMISDMLAAGTRKPIFGYRPMVVSLSAIAVLGFLVWGHHMFTSGMQPGLGSIFMVATMVIALPSGMKTFNWLATLWRSKPKWTPFMGAAVGFISLWVIGGLSGIFLAATPVDVQVHDTYLVVAHFHYIVFGATLFASFAGLYYWFPKMFGRRMNATLCWLHLIGSFVLFNLVFFPMHVLGTHGFLRRIADPYAYGHLQGTLPLNRFISICAFLLMAWQALILLNLFFSALFGRREQDANPWRATTLEWTTSTPPLPAGNFETLPVVVRGPYEYGATDDGSDHRPQADPLPSGR